MYRVFALIICASVAFAEQTSGGNGAPAPAPAPGGGDGAQQAAQGPGSGLFTLIIFGIVGFMLFSMIRGQRKEQKKQRELIAGAKLGDMVETIGGLRGEIVRKGETDVDIRTGGADGCVVTFSLGAIKAQVVAPGEKDGK